MVVQIGSHDTVRWTGSTLTGDMDRTQYRTTHRFIACDTSHLPNDCGPQSAFGYQSTKKNSPAFMFSRTSRTDRARSNNFDQRHMAEALLTLESDGKRRDVKPPVGQYEPEARWDTMGTKGLPGFTSRTEVFETSRNSDVLGASVSSSTSMSSRYPKQHAHDFGRSIGREDKGGTLKGNVPSISSDPNAIAERRFGADVPRYVYKPQNPARLFLLVCHLRFELCIISREGLIPHHPDTKNAPNTSARLFAIQKTDNYFQNPRMASGDVSSFGKQVARKSSTFHDVSYDTMLSRTRRDLNDKRMHLGGALEATARGAFSPSVTKTAVVLSSVGPQKLSTKKNSPALSWGNSPRSKQDFPVKLEDTYRGPGMYHHVRDFRDVLREHRKTRKAEVRQKLGRTSTGNTTGNTGQLPELRHRNQSPTYKITSGRPAGVKYWQGVTRREPRFYPTTSREVRDAYIRERDMGGRNADGAKRRLWA